MNDIVESQQPRRIRSFLIKDILEHKSPTEEQEIQLPTNSTEQSAQPNRPSTSYTVGHILGAANEERPSDPCITGCCDCPTVYPTYKNVAVTTPLYNPYLYSFYRQQAAWRQSLKDGVTYVDPQNALYSQVKQRKPRRPWTRAVFSNLQRKGLEKRFQVQKYLTKGDRHQLASMLGLSDNQVKVWFQNRRMKWRQEEQTGEESEKLQEKTEFQSSSSVIAKSSANTEVVNLARKD